VTEIYITPNQGSTLAHLNIDESRYKKLSGGHLPETRYINAPEGEALSVIGNEVRSIDYFAAADDSHLECPGLPKANITNCEYIPEPFASLGDISFELDKFFLDNFSVVALEKRAITYIIAYSGKRARPDEAKKRANRARNYLVAVRHFPNDHVKIIDGGYREKRDLVLYIVSEGVCPPTPLPTVDPRDVEIIKR
jgi:hypothetical protein